MGYPNPMTVRTVKQVLKDGMYEAGLYGAASVVDALVGTFWGSLFTRSNRRDYLNFLGELAGRTITGQQKRIASNVYAYENMYTTKDSKKPAIRVPVNKGQGNYYNKDGGIRYNGHTYDSIDYDKRDSIVGGTFNLNNNSYHKRPNNQPKPQQSKPKDHSVLEDAINDICRVPMDFSISDFFRKIKEKVVSLVNRSSDKKQAGKDVLQGCYEFLEEQGQDGYSILVNILTTNARGTDFSESDEFQEAISLFSKLNDSQREAFMNALNISCGKEGSKLALESLQKGSEGVTIPASVVKIMKILGILTITIGLLKFAFKNTDAEDRKKLVPIT